MPDEPYTDQELNQFLWRTDAIAPIFIKDVAKLTECPSAQNFDAWMIGTVPSRQFRVVGLVVHTLFYDNERNWRTVHVVDDGTGCLEINHNEPKPPHLTSQFRSEPKDTAHSTKGRERQPVPSDQSDKATTRGPTSVLPDWSIGRFVVRVRQTPKARFIDLVSMERLRSVQEEVDHWKHVMRLHETRYREPFVIPTSPPPPLIAAPPPTTPVKRGSSTKPSPPPQIRLISPPISPVKEHVENDDRALLKQPPHNLKSADLNFTTFVFYVMFFLHHDPLPDRFVQAQSLGFTLEYLHRVPDLRYLARRILLAEARRGTRDYLKSKRSALEPTDHNRPPSSSKDSRSSSQPKLAPLTDADLTRKINDMIVHALRRLLAKGDVIMSYGSTRPIPPEMTDPPGRLTADYPQCLGKFRLWESPPPLQPGAAEDETNASLSLSFSRISSSKSTASKKKSWRTGLQDHDGPIERLPPCPIPSSSVDDVEAFFVVTPQLMKAHVLKAINLLKRRKVLGHQGGGSPSDIVAVLRRDDQWRKISEEKVGETLEVLAKEEMVWNYLRDQWTTV